MYCNLILTIVYLLLNMTGSYDYHSSKGTVYVAAILPSLCLISAY